MPPEAYDLRYLSHLPPLTWECNSSYQRVGFSFSCSVSSLAGQISLVGSVRFVASQVILKILQEHHGL